jgi:hypothetical protein
VPTMLMLCPSVPPGTHRVWGVEWASGSETFGPGMGHGPTCEQPRSPRAGQCLCFRSPGTAVLECITRGTWGPPDR